MKFIIASKDKIMREKGFCEDQTFYPRNHNSAFTGTERKIAKFLTEIIGRVLMSCP